MTGYLIDGYNFLHAVGILHGKVGPAGLEKARQRLLGLLAGAFKDNAPQVTVVFDARHAPVGVPPPVQEYKGIHVEFAVGQQEADDWIEHHIAKHSSPRKLTVVSNDRRLRDAAQRRGATSMACEDLLDQLLRRRPKRPSAAENGGKKDRLSAKEIERWVEEFAGIEDEPELKEALKPFDFEKE